MSMDTDANCTARIPPSKVQMNDLGGSSCQTFFTPALSLISILGK